MDEARIQHKLSLRHLGLTVVAPDVSELTRHMSQGKWFSGAEIGHEHHLNVQVAPGTALLRLVRHFGLPNSPEYHQWTPPFLAGRDKTSWEYLLLVNDTHYFAVYDRGTRITVGYRLITSRGSSCLSRQDFNADRETCARVCRYIEAVTNFPPEAIQAPWRGCI